MTQIALANALEITREQVGKYERGINWPGGEVLFSFSQRGADALYVLTGERRTVPSCRLNAALLRCVLEHTEEALHVRRQRLPPVKKADLVSLLYEHFGEVKNVERGTVERFLRLAD